MKTDAMPTYCNPNGGKSCHHVKDDIPATYGGKYFRPECARCWRNNNRPQRKASTPADRTKIKIIKNTSHHRCPICDLHFKEREYVVNLGFAYKHVLVHMQCFDAFIKKIQKFREEEFDEEIAKITTEVL